MQPKASGTLRTLGKHQLASLAATVVDFGTMVLLVELCRFSPELATPIGALGGAITNFTVSRHWAFRGAEGAVHAQMARYAVVSAASAGWNALGEYVLHHVFGVEYIVARLITAVVVSLAWNFPLHRNFVFPRAKEVTIRSSASS